MNDSDQNLGWDDAKSGGFTLPLLAWESLRESVLVAILNLVSAQLDPSLALGHPNLQMRKWNNRISQDFHLTLYWLFLTFVVGWHQRAGGKTFACYFRRTHPSIPPLFSSPCTSLFSNQTSTSEPSLCPCRTQVHRLGSKLDRNCGKKPQKQMPRSTSSSSHLRSQKVRGVTGGGVRPKIKPFTEPVISAKFWLLFLGFNSGEKGNNLAIGEVAILARFSFLRVQIKVRAAGARVWMVGGLKQTLWQKAKTGADPTCLRAP